MTSPESIEYWLGQCIGERQRYRIDRRIGGGGMGDVFLATDTLMRQPVALKLLNDKLPTGELRRRFEREVAVSAALRNEHIVSVRDYGITPEGHPFYVMEYLQGQTLGKLMRREKSLAIDRTACIVAQVCVGLQRAHQGIHLPQAGNQHVKVIHRDLKPDNIFLVPTALGELVKILDFGIAKLRSDQAELTCATNVFLGTYHYAAPEQFEVEQDLDERADIYSLGMILYEMLAGVDPFGFSSAEHPSTGVAWAVAHLSKPVQPLRRQPGCEHLPPNLEAVVLQCLEKVPAQRFASVSELHQALHAAVPSIGDRSLTIMEPLDVGSRESAIFLNPLSPTQPARVKRSPPATAASTVAMTRRISTEETLAVSTAAPSPVTSADAIARSRKAAVLLAGVSGTIALAAGLGIYYSSQSVALFTTPDEISSSQKSETPSATDVQAAAADANTLVGHTDTVWAVALNPAADTVISSSFDKTIRLWDSQTGKLLRTLSGHTDAVRAIALTPDGQRLASAGGDKTIKVWNLETGILLYTLPGHSRPVWSLAISPDGKTLASGGYDGTIKLWNLQTRELLNTIPEHYDSVWSVAISPDGKALASGSYDGTIKLWNLQTGSLMHTLSGHSDSVRTVGISPDGKTLVSGSWDKTVKVWDLASGTLLHTLTGHTDRVLSVAISRSGQTVASSSNDRTIRLWNLRTGRLLHSFSGHQDWVTSVALSADGKTLVSGSKDKTVKIWRW